VRIANRAGGIKVTKFGTAEVTLKGAVSGASAEKGGGRLMYYVVTGAAGFIGSRPGPRR